MKKFLILEATDYLGYPAGGQSTFAERMIKSFPGEIGLVGIRTDPGPIGIWHERKINGVSYPFLAVRREKKSARRPLIPTRLRNLLNFRKHRDNILSFGLRTLFVQAPEIILALGDLSQCSVCYRFPGVAPPLARARYPVPPFVIRAFESAVAKHLAEARVLLATADTVEIDEYAKRQGQFISKSRLHWFPTRYDESIFFLRDKALTRQSLGLSPSRPIFLSTGRLNRRKGWDLLLEAFAHVLRLMPDAQLVFVGDGEDRDELMKYAARLKIQQSILVTGHVGQSHVGLYDSACDVFVNASHFEGWPNAIVEALACGRAVVSTDVSGARQMIRDGENGFIVISRDAKALSEKMLAAFYLKDASALSIAAVAPYGAQKIKEDLIKLWPEIA